MTRIDETGNIYGSFKVISYEQLGWILECQRCGCQIKRKGAELRRYKMVHCKNCCGKCGTKRNDDFRGNICKKCSLKQVEEWKSRDPEKHKKRLRDWHNRCSPEIKKQYRQTEAKRIQSKPETFLKHLVNERCRLNKRRRIPREFNIDPEYIIGLWHKQDGKCAISGLQMEHCYNTLLTVSIDRIDSAQGYIEGNVQLVCKWANYAKSDAPNDEMLAIINMLKS